ncbi:MAG: sel1 repeat family protein [Ignavibacteriales bacterium]|nr:MAG: sel1 repeat family protein [Ignavibacteriales bacterium]
MMLLRAAALFILLFPMYIYGQGGSLAFKRNQPVEIYRTYYPVDFSPQIFESFILVRKANDGDPLAQHELGLRYLTGNGFEPDTAKAFVWVKRSAEQKYPLAAYNLGIFYMNGLGTEWNPYLAFENFLYAAGKDIPEAQFAAGVIYTEDLVVRRDLMKAKFWFEKAVKNGNPNAPKALLAVEKDIAAGKTDKKRDEIEPSNPISKNVTLQYINFTDTTVTLPPDSLLLADFYEELFRTAFSYKNLTVRDSVLSDSAAENILSFEKEFDRYAFPEGLLLAGRIYQLRSRTGAPSLAALYYYIRALKEGSPYAGIFLWKLISDHRFFNRLYAEINKGSAEAEYVLGTLRLLRLEFGLTEKDAVTLIERSAGKNFIPSMIEAGNMYFNGSSVKRDTDKAFQYWQSAAELGAYQAVPRQFIASVAMGREYNGSYSALMENLNSGYAQGSLLAETVIGYFYEKGILVRENKSEAYRYYRNAASRGSNLAYALLKSLYAKPE